MQVEFLPSHWDRQLDAVQVVRPHRHGQTVLTINRAGNVHLVRVGRTGKETALPHADYPTFEADVQLCRETLAKHNGTGELSHNFQRLESLFA